MEERTITNQESFEIITKMINKAKRNVARGGSFYFLFWGILSISANIAHWYLMKFTDYPHPYIVWSIMIPAGIFSVVYSFRQGKKTSVTEPYDRLYGQLWMGLMISAAVVLLLMPDSLRYINPIILSFAGMGTFFSGRLLRFNPLILGGIALWIFAGIGFKLSFADQYLLGAIALLIGYIVPGVLLKRAENE